MNDVIKFALMELSCMWMRRFDKEQTRETINFLPGWMAGLWCCSPKCQTQEEEQQNILREDNVVFPLDRVLGLPVNRTWLQARQEIQAKLYWGLWYSRGNENKRQVSLLAPWVGGKLVSYMRWGYSVSKGYSKGGVGVFPTPLVVFRAEGMHSTQLLLLIPYFSSRFFRRGSMVFLKSLSIFLKKYLFTYLFIWLPWTLVASCRIFYTSCQIFHCSAWTP